MLRLLCRCAVALRDESGATAIEYALLAGLIAAVIIGMTALLGETVAGAYDSVNDAFAAAGL